MFEEYKNRMKRKGKYLSDALRYNSEVVVNATWMQSTSYRPVIVKRIESGLPVFDEDTDEILDAHFEQKSKYNITGDEVAYWLRFRPRAMQDHPEIAVGSYVSIPDCDGDRETWLIIHVEDDGEQKWLQVLKTNYVYKWIYQGKIYEVLGCQRYASSYNSGVFFGDRTTSIENINGFWCPTNSDTAKIGYDQRFIISDGSREVPICWSVSKIETTIPVGLTKFALSQVSFDPIHDNAELGICNYYDSPITPEVPDLSTELQRAAIITYSGTRPTIKVGGSAKTFTAVFKHEDTTVSKWTVSDENGDISANTNYIIEYVGNQMKIKVAQNYNLIGTVLIVQAIGSDGSTAEVEIEVIG